MKRLYGLNEYLRAKYSGKGHDPYFRLRYRQDRAFEDVESGKPTKAKSPAAWSVTASILSDAVKYLVNHNDDEAARHLAGSSAERAMRCMIKAAQQCHTACEDYRRRGIDPQVHAIIRPNIERCQAAYKLYEEWRLAKGTTGPAPPPAIE